MVKNGNWCWQFRIWVTLALWLEKNQDEDQTDEIELLKKTDLATFNKCTKIKRGCDKLKYQIKIVLSEYMW